MVIRLLVSFYIFFCHSLIDWPIFLVFIAEKGPECFSSKQDEVQNCVNATFHSYMPTEKLSLENLPNLILTERECQDMEKLQKCIVNELENCEESTPANLVESLFKFIKNETLCATVTAPQKADNRSAANYSNVNQAFFNVLTGTWLMILIAKLVTFH